MRLFDSKFAPLLVLLSTHVAASRCVPRPMTTTVSSTSTSQSSIATSVISSSTQSLLPTSTSSSSLSIQPSSTSTTSSAAEPSATTTTSSSTSSAPAAIPTENVVQNPSFSTGSLSPWVSTINPTNGGTVQVLTSCASPDASGACVYLRSLLANAKAGISQSLATVPGATYNVSFSWRVLARYLQSTLVCSVDNGDGSSFSVPISTVTSSTWATASFPAAFVASSDLTTFKCVVSSGTTTTVTTAVELTLFNVAAVA